MIILYGKKLFGKVDRFDDRLFVATNCYHIFFLPLIPVGTYIVLREPENPFDSKWRGIKIPFSLKSWLAGWVKIPLWFLAITGPIGALISLLPHKTVSGTVLPFGDRLGACFGVLLFAAISAALLFAIYKTPGLGRATRNREIRLRQYLTEPQPVPPTIPSNT